MRNHYGSLCTEMYEALHPAAPEDELGFYLSYARRGQRIFEPLCGSGRFLVPFLERGFDVGGMDSSEEMLAKLKEKAPDAQVVCATVEEWRPAAGEFGYLFITSGSLSLFTDADACRAVLRKVRGALRAGGVFAFAVDTVAAREPDSAGYEVGASVKTAEGLDLILKSKYRYDEATRTQFSPGIYELYDGDRLLRSEPMDFQTHLYGPGEMNRLLREVGFSQVKAYSSFDKAPAAPDAALESETLLYECTA